MQENKKRNAVIAVLCVLIVFFTILFSVIFVRQRKTEILKDTTTASLSETSETSDTQTTEEPTKKNETETTLKAENNPEPQSTEAEPKIKSVCGKKYVSEETGRIVVDPANENWNLVVVNAGREYVSTYKPELAEIVKGSGKYLDKRVAPYYDKMYAAAKKDGLTLTPYSAYRSYERQKNNYENLTAKYKTQYNLSGKEAAKKAATVILPPGTSEHNLGLAIDIQGTSSTFANTKEYAWLMKHAQDYGFILRYTAEKQDITGIIPEPWHWRFVGVEEAKEIKASGLCLEEFLESKGIEY